MFLAAALNYDAATAAATALRDTLLPITYFLCFLGFVECVARSHGDGEHILMFFISIACIVILAANFPAGITLLKNGINGMMDTHNEHVNNLFYQILNANLSNEPSMWDVGNYILYGIIKLLQGIGKFGIIIIELIQSVSLIALVAISPILIGMLATSWTRSAGVRFLMTSLIICMWSIGIALVDLVLFAIGQYIFAAAIGAGTAGALGAIGAGTAAGVTLTTLALPSVLLVVGIAALVPIALYLAIPIIMHAVMMGANPLTSSLSAGAGLAATAIGISGANAARAASTAAGMASRGLGGAGSSGSESQNISPASQGITPPSPGSSGGESAPVAGVVQYSSGAFGAANDASYTTAPAGHQADAPGGGGMTATQVNSAAFSITTASGASREFPGNIGSPQDLAAAYNTMISTTPRQQSSSTINS
jgi:hypothetical protein